MASVGLQGSPLTAEKSSLRSATNLRTVSRNDPAVSEILDTSTYSVIYHYDADAGKWQKQKQEGSLFVVRRTKAPEYALFMLNRVTVKNVTIPLIPGEMKATAIDASMLQVARRGEKIKYGIWFTEGTEGVQRFRDTIVRVCGEPSKTAATAGSTTAPAATPASNTPSSAPAAGPADDLSRLFAGLGTVPARSGTQTSPQPPQSQAAPRSAPLQTHHQSAPSSHPGGPPPAAYPAALPSAPPASSAPLQQQQQQPPAPPQYQPGETVDDLLMSILGPPVAPPPAPMQLGLGYQNPTPNPSVGLGHPPPMGGSPAPHIISGPCAPAPAPVSNYCAPHPGFPGPPPMPLPNQRMPSMGPSYSPPNGIPHADPALRDAVAHSIPSSTSSSPTPAGPAPPDFRAFLADLVNAPHNTWFVDQVFAAYNHNLERNAKRHQQQQQQQQQQHQQPGQGQQGQTHDQSPAPQRGQGSQKRGGSNKQPQPNNNQNQNQSPGPQGQGSDQSSGNQRRGGNRPSRGRQQQQQQQQAQRQ